jgi:hypothetical protein
MQRVHSIHTSKSNKYGFQLKSMKRKKATKENILGLGYEIYGNAYSHPLPFLENIYEKWFIDCNTSNS